MLYKYPRTYHLPWSLGITSDDKILSDISCFQGKKLVGTIKMDGENTSFYRNNLHARSLDSKDHPSRHWIKSFHSSIKHLIPNNWRICGENLFAKHSIFYNNLESYFLGFSIWDDRNVCLNWEKTLSIFSDLGIKPVPIITETYDINEIIEKFNNFDKQEGYVIRIFEEFKYENFSSSIAKFVRKNHVSTDKHWMFKKIEKNLLDKSLSMFIL